MFVKKRERWGGEGGSSGLFVFSTFRLDANRLDLTRLDRFEKLKKGGKERRAEQEKKKKRAEKMGMRCESWKSMVEYLF